VDDYMSNEVRQTIESLLINDEFVKAIETSKGLKDNSSFVEEVSDIQG